MEQMALYVLGGNNQEDLEPGSEASNKARRVDSSADLSSSSDDEFDDWNPAEMVTPAALQEDILAEPSIVPDTMETPWTIPFDLIGSLSLTATLIIFSNFASRLVFSRLVYPDSIPLYLTGDQVFLKNAGRSKDVLSELHLGMEAQNSLGYLTPIERALGVVSDEAVKICRDLELEATTATEAFLKPNLGSLEDLNNFLLVTTPRRLWEFRTKLDSLRLKLEADVLVPLSDLLRMPNRIPLDSMKRSEHTEVVTVFSRLQEDDAGSLLARFPEEALPNPRDVSSDNGRKYYQGSGNVLEEHAGDNSSNIALADARHTHTVREFIASAPRLSNSTMPHRKRQYSLDEKAEVREIRTRRACEDCRRRKTKCKHRLAGSEFSSNVTSGSGSTQSGSTLSDISLRTESAVSEPLAFAARITSVDGGTDSSNDYDLNEMDIRAGTAEKKSFIE
ncbi:hypothetical protein ONS95_004758 [Cadophora gregata]|uniref:uncharacterized protein n=1 Tax=Cadophora gregata TaxID=51156 RepID=UPI0026DC9BBB|nr:uncharacterized protein ONS95_004758 [Cadophora gregata]KAK0104469.1 hypothetical protein ONS95_004758 [Cadophora gregata]